jgi:glycosyltransferase involved in cell wall biosynthesis
MIKKGWLVNDTLTCIPGTKTFWHDLLEWLPNLYDKCNGHTPYHLLPSNIESQWNNGDKPNYIIRNATYFRPLNIPVKTISLLQDLSHSNQEQINVCNSSDIVVFNSPYTQSHYVDKITSKTVMIPLGVDFDKFKPLGISYQDELGILPNSILFIGSATDNPKGFDILTSIIENTNYNFCLVMKDGYTTDNKRVKLFNRVDHDLLVKIMNSCEMLVCTSRVETQHLSGIEAASSGLPIVTSNVGIYFNLESGKWGRNVMSFDYHDFIREIEYVKKNKEEFNPREVFLKLGLDTNTCKNRWIELVDSL